MFCNTLKLALTLQMDARLIEVTSLQCLPILNRLVLRRGKDQ